MKKLSVSLLVVMSLLLSSCVTRYIRKDHSYDEVFYSYYTSRYGDELVFIGKEFHYVFKDDSKQIAELAKPKWREKLAIKEINLFVNRDNEVGGHVVLEVITSLKNLKSDEINLLKEYGFNDVGDGFVKKMVLNGVRYVPRPSSNQDNKGHLKKSYTAKIKYKLNHDEEVRKALLTPIAVTTDGLIILVGGITIPLLIIAFTK